MISDKILDVIDTSTIPLSGRNIYNVLSKEIDDLLPGSVSNCIWNLVSKGILIVRLDLKVVRA